MNTKFRYARNGALIIGVPFALWSLFLFITVYTSNDSSLGSVISFGIGVPSVILGFPWSPGAIVLIAKLPMIIKESIIYPPVIIIGYLIMVLSPAINGAIIGYRIGIKKQEKRREKTMKHNQSLKFDAQKARAS
jgi:hypothetical protein